MSSAECHIGGGVGEHIGRVPHAHAAARRFGNVDVVVAHREIADDFKLRPGGVEELGIDLFGEQREHAFTAANALEQLGAIGRQIAVPHIGLASGDDFA